MSACLLHRKCVATSERHFSLTVHNRRDDDSAHWRATTSRRAFTMPHMRECASHELSHRPSLQPQLARLASPHPIEYVGPAGNRRPSGLNRRVKSHKNSPASPALDARTFLAKFVSAASSLQTQSRNPATRLSWSDWSSHDMPTCLAGDSLSYPITSPQAPTRTHRATATLRAAAILMRAAKVRLPRLCASNSPFTCLLTRRHPQEARDAQRSPRPDTVSQDPSHTRLPSFRRLQAQRPRTRSRAVVHRSCGTTRTATSPIVPFGLRHCMIVYDGPAASHS
ncbi:hypothetical protein GY45DRAFT_284704 [Cubamyces sp. BRFM 1775]|nr:hypothetical protein GY45DRAFT_284704 [Cubamyces sp. BRFM 1775]